MSNNMNKNPNSLESDQTARKWFYYLLLGTIAYVIGAIIMVNWQV
jgi:hypothetical protein